MIWRSQKGATRYKPYTPFLFAVMPAASDAGIRSRNLRSRPEGVQGYVERARTEIANKYSRLAEKRSFSTLQQIELRRSQKGATRYKPYNPFLFAVMPAASDAGIRSRNLRSRPEGVQGYVERARTEIANKYSRLAEKQSFSTLQQIELRRSQKGATRYKPYNPFLFAVMPESTVGIKSPCGLRCRPSPRPSEYAPAPWYRGRARSRSRPPWSQSRR